MRFFFYSLIFGISVLLLSCGKEKTAEKGKIFTSQEIGWTFEIPEGWQIVENEKPDQKAKSGQEAVESTLNKKVATPQSKVLLTLQKNQFSSFGVAIDPMETSNESNFEETVRNTKQFLCLMYEDEGYKIDTTVTEKETIDGLEFRKYTITLYDMDLVPIKQIMYHYYFNGYFFSATTTGRFEKDRNEILAAFKQSKFKK